MPGFHRMRWLAALLPSALLAGCESQAPVGESGAAVRSLPVTAAWVSVGTTDSSAPRVESPKWVVNEAHAAGHIVNSVGVWQELPRKSKYCLLCTNRESVHCRLVEQRDDGYVVIEAWTQVGRVARRIVLKPGISPIGFAHLSGQDAVAVRLGWEGNAPAPVFARAILAHGKSSRHRTWPADLPKWAVQSLRTLHDATGCEDLGTGEWIEIGPDPTVLAQTPTGQTVQAHITLREHNGWVNATALISSSSEVSQRESVTVQPVIPGNDRPGAICSFQQSDDEDSYVSVVFHYGRPPSAKSGVGDEKRTEP